MPKRKTKRTNSFKRNKIKKQQVNYSFAVFVGWTLILWGSFYFVRKFFWQQYTTQKILTNESYFVTNIDFPSLDEEKEVVTTHVKNGEWLLVDGSANYVYESARPGEEGSVIIYGHNVPSVFSNLEKLKEGDDIVLKTENGRHFYYLVEDKQIVSPDKVDLLVNDEESLVLYTCTGFLDSKRLVITAKPLF